MVHDSIQCLLVLCSSAQPCRSHRLCTVAYSFITRAALPNRNTVQPRVVYKLRCVVYNLRCLEAPLEKAKIIK
jgi:hypothetical protein